MSYQAKAELLVRGKELIAAFNRLDFEAAVGMYTEDATLLPEGGMPMNGRAGMCTTISKFTPGCAIQMLGTHTDTTYEAEFTHRLNKIPI